MSVPRGWREATKPGLKAECPPELAGEGPPSRARLARLLSTVTILQGGGFRPPSSPALAGPGRAGPPGFCPWSSARLTEAPSLPDRLRSRGQDTGLRAGPAA